MTVTSLRYNTDNFTYILPGTADNACIVIDPGHAAPILAVLSDRGWRPSHLLATHAHADHTAGAREIVRRTGCPPLRIPVYNKREKTEIDWLGGRLQIIPVPGHTRSDIAYYDPDAGILFTGDTLFVAGCGRLFECDAATMWNTLSRLLELPGQTKIYPGHDYAIDNLAFAAQLTPNDDAVAARLKAARTGASMVPSTLEHERRTNPFLRCADAEFRKRIGLETLTPAKCFEELRRRKDRW